MSPSCQWTYRAVPIAQFYNAARLSNSDVIPYNHGDDSRIFGSDGVAYMTTPQFTPPQTIVYIDSFNFYYGTLAQSPYRWLDLELLARRLRPTETIHKVKYFTAMVTGPNRGNQEAY